MGSRHEVRIRLISEPALWCWEVVEVTTGTVVESSWQSEWEAYETREAALAAARRTLGPRGRSARFTTGRRFVA